MKRFRLVLIIIAICLPATVGVCGQVQRPIANRPADAASDLRRVVEPESPATGSTVVPSPQAVVPRLMKFSGVLNDAAGKPLSGAVDVTFALYNTEAGGEPLWFETQSVQADELGRYTALLGAMHADGLPVDLFTSGEVRWLGIQIGSEAEQQPRVLLVSVPYALKAGDAETLGGKPASAYMLSTPVNGTTAATTASAPTASNTPASESNQKTRAVNNLTLTPCASVTSGGTAAASTIALFTSACNVESANLVQYNGNLGFGIATPQARLHIFGPDISDADARFNFILGDSTSATAGVGGGIDFSGYYSGTNLRAGFANIRGVKENATQGNYASALIFDTRANGGNQTERMRITSAGNVGIGTSAPVAKLGVIGNVNFTGAITSKGLVVQPDITDLTGFPLVGTNVIAGYTEGNGVTSGVTGATIAGGGGLANSSPAYNHVADDFGTIGGGYGNVAGTDDGNTDNATNATVAGGGNNTAAGAYSSVVGGYFNDAYGDGATVAGGQFNTADGENSFAAGTYALADNDGSFVWGDDNTFNLHSSANNDFTVRATGGVKFISGINGSTGDTTAGVGLAAGGGSWSSLSDRNMKANFVPVAGDELLAKLNSIPMQSWNYKAQPPSIRHMGPMAQDFYAAFGLGEDNRHITTVDEGGVALAGIQALYRLDLEKDARIQRLTAEVERLKSMESEMKGLEIRLARMEKHEMTIRTAHARTNPKAKVPGGTAIARARF